MKQTMLKLESEKQDINIGRHVTFVGLLIVLLVSFSYGHMSLIFKLFTECRTSVNRYGKYLD